MDISSLLDTLNQAASFPNIQTGTTDTERQALYYACEKLSTRLETPINRLMKTSFDFISPIILRTAIDIGIFDFFNKEHEPAREIDAAAIAMHTKCNQALIVRVMRLLISLHVVDVTSEGKCRANSFTKSFQPGTEVHALVIMLSSVFIPVLGRIPVYLRQNGNRPPENANNGVFQDALGTGSHIYDWFRQNKLEHDAFHQMMVNRPSSHGGMWTDYIPQQWILEKLSSREPSSHDFTIVDMGASSRNVLDALKQKILMHNVRLILQDLPDVTKGEHHTTTMCQTGSYAPEEIERMDHDFFDPQPVQGANVYVLARALHNWPDKEASKILQHIQAAMNQNSTLLIYDCVFSDRLEEVSYNDAISDMIMMAALASLERTEGQFRVLLHSVGLSLVNVWRSPLADDKQAILEIVRDDQIYP